MKARPYQIRAENEALAILRSKGGGGFLLTLEMRTGKTLVSLNVAKKLREKLVIVCPKVAVPVWEKAVKQLNVKESINGIFIVHYEALVADKKAWYRWGTKNKGFTMILDEAHFIKARGSSRSGAVRTLARRAKYRMALTGTPIAQGLQDAYALFNYLNPDYFGPWEDRWIGGLDGYIEKGFESTYLVYGGFKKKAIVGYDNQDQFNEIFHKYQFRITLREAKQEGGKGSMVLRYQKRYFDLMPEVKEGIYDVLQEELEAIVNEKKVQVPNVLSLVSKLQQIAGGFFIERVPTERYTRKGKPIYDKVVHSIPGNGKLALLKEEVKKVQGKFIVICRFIHELEACQKALQKRGYKVAIVAGGSPYDHKFGHDAICMQIQSGMAVDMSLADTVIFYSTDYSYINFEQSRFRILSYDKNYGKYVFLLARNTIDEVIYAAVRAKKKVADLVIDKYRKRKKRAVRQLAKTDRKPEGKTEGKTRRSLPIHFSKH